LQGITHSASSAFPISSLEQPGAIGKGKWRRPWQVFGDASGSELAGSPRELGSGAWWSLPGRGERAGPSARLRDVLPREISPESHPALEAEPL